MIEDDQGGHFDSFKINLGTFRTFIGQTSNWSGTFFGTQYDKPTLVY